MREAALAWQLEQKWSKDRILVAYLNTIYFGNGAYGIQQAARTYFGKGASRADAARGGTPRRAPGDPVPRTTPSSTRARARQRRAYVLALMFDQGITRTEPAHRGRRAAPLPPPDDVRLPGTQGPAPYFVNYVKDQLVAQYGAGRVFGGGLEVTTTIDLELQDLARTAIEKVLRNPDGPRPPSSPSTRAPERCARCSAAPTSDAASSTSPPRRSGSRGSSFKPIVLATAFRQGISPSTRFTSKPIQIDAGDRLWPVTNYEDKYLGAVDLATAMVSPTTRCTRS